MRTPDYYRHRAEEVRRLAEALSSPELRDEMNVVAKEYEDFAVAAEHLHQAFRDMHRDLV